MQSQSIRRLSGLLVLALLAACGSSSDSSSSSTTTTTDTTTKAAVPGDVVLSSPTASTASSSSLNVKAVGDAATSDYAARRTAFQSLSSGDNACAFTPQIKTVSSPRCYGPNLNYNGHPGASVADADTTDTPNVEDDDGQMPSGDLGLWGLTESSTGEGCAAAKMNELVDKVASTVDNVVNMFGVMACAGKKAGIALPAVGATVDLTAAMNTHMVAPGITISAATLTRNADTDANGDGTADRVFVSTMTATFGFGGATGTRTGTMTLKHIPTTGDNSTYKGKLSMKMSKDTRDGSNCGELAGVEAGAVDAGTILYEKTSASSVVYQVNYAQFCGKSTNPFDSSNNILPSDKATSTNLDGWADNWNYGLFSTNPSNGTGTFAYAWQAGKGDGNTRVLNLTTEVVSGGSNLTGTAYFGFGPDIETASGRGTITKMICNWAGPGNSHTGLTKAQKMVLGKASGATVWSNSSATITYAPTNSCDAAASDSFVYEAVDGNYQAVAGTSGKELSLTNDRITSTTAVTNDLVDLTGVSFTLPTAPSDV